ncbi:MAG: Wzz/FepE/Etk N-terminal domain-containing protein [Aquincola sp.]|nr:Wzz/FepE/Etk N-terminal domain-containing protein [Aquincola sp.]MDH5331468.1 Wzz/FepE/Etk N-terminal domain-containing protein [Aquincola sp.]
MPSENTGGLDPEDEGIDLLDLALPLAQHWKLLVAGPLLAGLIALGITFLIPKTYTSRTVFVPPQQQQSVAASAVAQLGALSGLVGAAAGIKSPADQYVALLQSATVADRLIDEFKLMKVYDEEFRFKAREKLSKNVRVSLGKKDGLITIEVDDEDPQRAADIANRHVEELRRLTSQLALTEAQQRRAFFEAQLTQTRDRLTQAQQALQASGFSQGALKADAKAAAEGYARLRAEATAAEVRLQTLRRNLADTTPEVQQAQSTLGALRAQLGKLEESTDLSAGPDYVSKFREFKYQETLFDLFARQYELAKLDESREGALIQVVDVAKPAEWKSKPKRALIAIAVTLSAFMLLVLYAFVRSAWRKASQQPETASKMERLRATLGPSKRPHH